MAFFIIFTLTHILPNILFIVDHHLNRSPSQRYRFEQYLNYFKSQGFNWELSEIITKKDDKIFYHPGNYFKKAIIILKSFFIRLKDLHRSKNYDIIFIQREALLIGSSFFEKQFYKKSNVVFDFDDSIWLLDTSPENKKFEFLKNSDKTKVNIANAHAVIAGNTYLANYANQFNKNVTIIPTTIDTSIHKPISKNISSETKKIVIGWSGSISTMKHFEMAIPVIKELLIKYPNQLEIHVIGQAAYKNKELEIISKSWHSDTEVADLNCFDIGIMPLPDDEWAKGKCGLKGLSYMACGIATVMSPVGVNTEIIQHNYNGYLATTQNEWLDALSTLIEKKEVRELIGRRGFETVANRYSIEANKHLYLDVFNSLIKY
jgi:glycosyltransferase involved in cell wall biosynthesis